MKVLTPLASGLTSMERDRIQHRVSERDSGPFAVFPSLSRKRNPTRCCCCLARPMACGSCGGTSVGVGSDG